MSEHTETPDCPRCDAVGTLEPYGPPDQFGSQWHLCTCCASRVFVSVSGRVIISYPAK